MLPVLALRGKQKTAFLTRARKVILFIKLPSSAQTSLQKPLGRKKEKADEPSGRKCLLFLNMHEGKREPKTVSAKLYLILNSFNLLMQLGEKQFLVT